MLTADRVAGALVLAKAVDAAVRGPAALPEPVWAAALGLWAAAGLALLAGPRRALVSRGCWAAVLLAGAGLAVDFPLDLRRQHLVLLLGLALAAVVAGKAEERLLLWRLQLSTLYASAALAKVNESFLGGDVLAVGALTGPLGPALPPLPPVALVAAAVAVVVVEAGLAVAPWVPRLRPAGLVVAAAVHTGALVLLSVDPLVGLRLGVFGGTAVLLHAVSAGLLPLGPQAPERWAERQATGGGAGVPAFGRVGKT